MIRYLIPNERCYIRQSRKGISLPIVVLISKPFEEEVCIPKLAIAKANGRDDLYESFLSSVSEWKESSMPTSDLIWRLSDLLRESIYHHNLFPTFDSVINIAISCHTSLSSKGIVENQEIDTEWLWQKFKLCLLEFEFIESVLNSNANISVGIFSEETCKAISRNLYIYAKKARLSSVDVENHKRWRVENHKYLWQLFE